MLPDNLVTPRMSRHERVSSRCCNRFSCWIAIGLQGDSYCRKPLRAPTVERCGASNAAFLMTLSDSGADSLAADLQKCRIALGPILIVFQALAKPSQSYDRFDASDSRLR